MTLTADRIALSWQRASTIGLDPALLPRDIDISSVPVGGRLMVAARPVLDRLTAIFTGLDCSVLLADRDVRLVDVRHGTPKIRGALTVNGAVAGRLFTEETAGTNSISTVRELQEPLAVRGSEHFFDAMKMFSCYGFPVLHPMTGSVEGVIAFTFYTASDSPLMHALVMQAADEISRRLVQHSLPSASDHDLFGAPTGVGSAFAGNEGNEGNLLTRGRSRTDRLADQLSHSRHAETSLAVAGEAGSGRTTVLSDLMGARHPVVFDAFEAVLHPAQQWLHGAIEALENGNRPVAVENVHLLTPPIAHALHVAMTRSRVWFAVSSAPLIALSSEVFRVVDMCRTRVELLPLRLRKHEIPAIVEQYLADMRAPIRFTPAAMHALIAHDWPGNLAELRSEVHAAARLRTVGDVSHRDLGRIQERSASRPLGAIDGALRTVIEDELYRHGGNKAAVAKALGISRTTLYKRMAAFGIDG
ncbi:MAG: helix-turn-helix domain-containing protein [Rhodococcus sp. (in: high G+C Gram-positive bacteria)]